MEVIKVLIVEDSKSLQDTIAHRLRDLNERIYALRALTISDAERLFAENPDIAAIAMDACVPGVEINTLPLVKKIRQTFVGPIIAISINEDFQSALMETGCDYESTKFDLPKKLLKILEI